jgi:ArsR family transcriptional regulator
MSKRRDIEIDRLAGMFKALSHPQRLRMFVTLASTCCVPAAQGDARPAASYCCAGDLGENLDIAPSTVSHHLKELRQAGVMQVERRGRRIDCYVTEETLTTLEAFFDRFRRQPGAACGSGSAAHRPVTRGGAR